MERKVLSAKGLISLVKKSFIKLTKVPSDTYMRERLDDVDPRTLRDVFKKIISVVQRGKVLESFQFLGHYLISVDGTGFFSSPKVFCENCCKKEFKDGKKEFYHNMFCGAIVYPGKKYVIPLAPEPIMRNDGQVKNDCEINAAKRYFADLRREHPHMKMIITADSLLAKGPIIRNLLDLNMSYIITAQQGDHKYLFNIDSARFSYFEHQSEDKKNHRYWYVNDVSINESNQDLLVNFIKYTQTDNKGKVMNFAWVTKIFVTHAKCVSTYARRKSSMEN